MNLTPIIPDDVIQELKQKFGNDYNWHNACARPHVVQSGDLIQLAWLFFIGCYNPDDDILYDLRSFLHIKYRRKYDKFVVTLEDKYIKTAMTRYVIAVRRSAEFNITDIVEKLGIQAEFKLFLFELLPDLTQIENEYRSRNPCN